MTYAPRNRVWSVAAPATLCVDVAEVRAQLRETTGFEDALVQSFAAAAQSVVEKRTQRLLTRRAATLRLPGLPSGNCPVELPGGEIGSITSVTADAVPVTGTTFVGDSPAILLPAVAWPAVTGEGYPVVIVYQAGFANVPDDLKVAVRMLAAEMFERRAHGDSEAISEVPVSAHFLMEPWRIRPVG